MKVHTHHENGMPLVLNGERCWVVTGDPLPPPNPYPRYLSPQQYHDLEYDRFRWRRTIYRFVDPTKAGD